MRIHRARSTAFTHNQRYNYNNPRCETGVFCLLNIRYIKQQYRTDTANARIPLEKKTPICYNIVCMYILCGNPHSDRRIKV